MKQATIENHTHAKPTRNSTHRNAWAIGRLITQWHWYNVLYLFRPPMIESVVIVPNNLDIVDTEDNFEADMFHPRGIFSDVPLAHYLKVHVRGIKGSILLNAGFLIDQFLLGYRYGGLVLREVIKHAKEKQAIVANGKTAIEGLEDIQEQSVTK